VTFDEIQKQFKGRNFKPIYFLHGVEAFYTDALVDFAAKNILQESERDFNQTIFYAKDTPPINVIDAATRLPLMSDYNLVIVKEAQEYSKATQWEIFEKYIDTPSSTTILKAVIFESEGVKDYKLPAWINSHVRANGYNITDKAVALVAEFVGNDLSRITKELEKLFIIVKEGEQINEKHIERHIGISKDYNVFELVNAVLEKDILKANRIIKYFAENPKATHITVVLGSLYGLYQRLFKTHFAKTNDPGVLAKKLKIHPYPAKELLLNKKKHPAKMISRNFSILREYDLLSKGVGTGGTSESELMRELIFRLLH
jgi:DNA polymerase-3 subunit delta